MSSSLGPPIDEATLSFVRRVVLESVGTQHPSLNEAFNAFSTAFDQWNPQQLLDIKPSDKPVIDFLFSSAIDHHCMASSRMYQLRHEILIIVDKWMSRWDGQLLSADELQSTIEIIQTDTWDTYQDFIMNRGHTITKVTRVAMRGKNKYHTTPCLLPTIEALQSRWNEMNRVLGVEEQIQKYFSVDIHGQTYELYNIAAQYSCKSMPVNLFTHYDNHHRYTESMYTNHNLYQQIDYLMRNLQPEQKLEYLRKTFDPEPDLIYNMTYFHLYPSILCNDAIGRNSTIRANSQEKPVFSMGRITQAIGPKMTYGGVVCAMKLLKTNELLNTELKTLLSNERLQLTSLDVTNFRVVKLLYDISIPLQGFIKACVQYEFQITDSDATFKSLQTEVKKFYATESNDRQTCLSFFNRLYDILCFQPPNGTNDSNNNSNQPAVSDHPRLYLLYQINELTKIMALLEPLSYTSHGPKLWQYFREMRWFERDAKFESDYGSVSTALSSYGAIQEALIVESLGPVARYFIAVEELDACQSIKLMLKTVRDDNRIRTIKQGTPKIETDIHKMNSRLNSIKDLFQHVYILPSTINPVTTPQSTATTTTQATPQVPRVQTMGSTPQSVPTVQSSTPQTIPQPPLVPSMPPVEPRVENFRFGCGRGGRSSGRGRRVHVRTRVLSRHSHGTTGSEGGEDAAHSKNNWGDTFAQNEGTWKCQVCLVMNDDKSSKCAACEATRPFFIFGSKTKPTNQVNSAVTVNQQSPAQLFQPVPLQTMSFPMPATTSEGSRRPQPSLTPQHVPQNSLFEWVPPSASQLNTFGVNFGPATLPELSQPKTTNQQPSIQSTQPVPPQPTEIPSTAAQVTLQLSPTDVGQSSLAQTAQMTNPSALQPPSQPQQQLDMTQSPTPDTVLPATNGRCTIHVGSSVMLDGVPVAVAPQQVSSVPQHPTRSSPPVPLTTSTSAQIHSTATQPNTNWFTFTIDSGVNLTGIYIFQFGSSSTAAPQATVQPPPPEPMTPLSTTAAVPREKHD